MTVLSAAAVLRNVRTGKSGANMEEQPSADCRANKHRQYDAARFLFGTGKEICLTDILNAWENDTLQERADVRRHVLPYVVFCSIMRSRLFCNGCSAVSDVLQREPCVKLGVGRAEQQSLPGMLDKEFKGHGTEDSLCPAVCGCRRPADARKQRFPAREPAVMCFHLIRAQRNGRNNSNAVEFPEVSTCMRMGANHFASIVRRKSRASNQGHYLATCWREGNRYTDYTNDVITDVTWQGVATKQVQREASVLMYVCIGFGKGWPATAQRTRLTPAMRLQLVPALRRQSWRLQGMRKMA